MTRAEILAEAKPILFNTEMVRAILDGRKTQTRRVVKDIPTTSICTCVYRNSALFKWQIKAKNADVFFEKEKEISFTYQPGDILYVRETWNKGYIESGDAEYCNEHWFEEINKYDDKHFQAMASYFYRSDYSSSECNELAFTWKPSIHMPKEAARIFLRVTGVRAERLQDITYEDLQHEGMWDDYQASSEKYHENLAKRAYPIVFSDLWNSTIKKKDLPLYGWKANPWVWVYEFERIEVTENG